jgi:hypothetical protein
MFDENENVIEVGNTVKVLKYFSGIVEKIVYGESEYMAWITWEIRGRLKYGCFFADEFTKLQ